MDTTTILFITNYLNTMELPSGASRKIRNYLTRNVHKFIILNDILYRFNPNNNHSLKKVLNIEESLEAFTMYHHHPMGGHFAHANTLYKISLYYYWDSMSKDIHKYIRECQYCQQHGNKTVNESLHPIQIDTTLKPFEMVGIDVKHVTPSRSGHRYVIVAICYLTKYVECKALTTQTSADVAQFLHSIICRHGAMRWCHTDNGKPMISELIQTVCKKFNIIHKTITPYNSQSQGMVERFNRILDQVLKRRTINEKLDWDTHLEATLFAYHTIKQAATLQSPFFMMYGYDAHTPFDKLSIPYHWDDQDFVREINNRVDYQLRLLSQVRQQAVKSIRISQINQIKRIEKTLLNNKSNTKPAFTLGDQVYVYRDYLTSSWSGKIEIRWDGPFIIHEILNKGTYLVKNLLTTDLKLRRVHGNRMKIHHLPSANWDLLFTKLK